MTKGFSVLRSEMQVALNFCCSTGIPGTLSFRGSYKKLVARECCTIAVHHFLKSIIMIGLYILDIYMIIQPFFMLLSSQSQ